MKSKFLVNLIKKKIPLNLRRTIVALIQHPLRQWMFSTMIGKFGFKIVTREKLFEGSEKYRIFQFGSEEKTVVSEPYQLDELPRELTRKTGTFTLKKPFVSEVKNAEIVGSLAVGFDEENNLISETVTPSPRVLKNYLSMQTFILKIIPNLGIPQLDTACSLVNCWSHGYYHWIVDCLLRLEGLESYQQQTGRKPILIIDANPTSWQKESLRLLGYEPDNCIQWRGSKLKVKFLVIPSFRREQLSLVSVTACQWLRQRMLSNLPDVGSKERSFTTRIYISRPKTVGRNVVNEDEVLATLAPLGFVAYQLETLSFSDQVRLFSQAEIVVATHGAGLTNMIFAQNLSVIELFGVTSAPFYFVLATTLGFQYKCLSSDQNGRNPRSIEKHNGITVDTAKLQVLVEEMLSVSSDLQPAKTIC